MPTPEQEAKKREGHKPNRGGVANPKKRKENAGALASLPTTIVPHPIAEDERRCAHCGDAIKPIGGGDRSVEYEWIPGRLERRMHVVEVGRGPCKMHYARGPAPRRVQEGCMYGPAFLAKLAVDKCADATPIYRVEKQMRRAGIPISRSTLNDLVLLSADSLPPLWQAAREEIPSTRTFRPTRRASHADAHRTLLCLDVHLEASRRRGEYPFAPAQVQPAWDANYVPRSCSYTHSLHDRALRAGRTELTGDLKAPRQRG